MFRILLLIFSLNCFAQLPLLSDVKGEKVATSALAFLKLPVGAAGAALGGNAQSILDDPAVMLLNPAMLVPFRENRLLLSHQSMPMGLRHEFAGFVIPTYAYGTFGIAWNMLGSGTIENARNIDEEPVAVSSGDVSVTAAYAVSFFANRFWGGVNIQYLQSRLAEVVARGICGDIGFSARLPFAIRTSLAIKHLGNGITYTSETEPLPTGLAWDIGGRFLDNRIGASAGVSKLGDAPLKATAGIEAVLHTSLLARVGYVYSLADEEESAGKGLRAGIGIRYGRFTADYGYVRNGEWLQGSHVFDAGFRFGRLLPITDEDYLKRAKRHFRKAEYEECIEAARRALRLNPALWQARILMDEAMRMLRVQEKTLIALFYTGDTRGAFTPGSGFGGLARRSGMLKTLYESYPVSLAVEAGNFLREGMEYGRAEAGYKILKRMKYTAVNFGNSDYALEADSVLRAADRAGIACLSSNLKSRSNRHNPVTKDFFVLDGKYSVTILGMLKPEKSSGKAYFIADPVAALGPLVAEARQSSNLVIVLSTSDIADCKTLAKSMKGIDVIVSGSGSAVTYSPEQVGKTLILSPGSLGENLGFLALQFSKEKKIVSFSHRIIPLGPSAPEDAAVARLLKKTLIQPDSIMPPAALMPSPYLLPFVSSHDMIAYHFEALDQAVVDSLALVALRQASRAEDMNVDSIRRAIRKTDTLHALEAAKKAGLSGIYNPSDTLDQIYLYQVVERQIRRITWNQRRNYSPLMNGAGSALLYFSDTLTGKITLSGTDKRALRTDLFVYNLPYDYTVQVLPEKGCRIISAVWSSDGKALYTIERDKTGFQSLYLKMVGRQGTLGIIRGDNGSVYEVAVSPDGQNIAYTSDREEGVQLYSSDPMGEEPVRLTLGAGYCSRLAFSRTGRYLAFGYGSLPKELPTSLFVLDMRTHTLDTVTRGQPVHGVIWNGDQELFVTQGIRYTDINVVDVKSHEQRRLTRRSEDSVISERFPMPFSVGSSVQVFYEADDTRHSRILTADGETGEVKSLFPDDSSLRLK